MCGFERTQLLVTIKGGILSEKSVRQLPRLSHLPQTEVEVDLQLLALLLFIRGRVLFGFS
ncbi:Uncharacterised protein [Vibrio cholerae]|nr:Uncharacterised protein [Vibrio cholerae]